MGGIIVPVPHQYAFVVEQFGKYNRTLQSGLNFLIPFAQRVRYRHSLKEQTFMINAQNAVTRDNVIIQLDGVLYMKIDDPVKCSYGAVDPLNYAQILAQSVMRSEIGKLTLDQTFEERDKLNQLILSGISQAVAAWGMKCLRYEIKDIKVSETIRKVMNLEAEAERQKRADILKSEGVQQSEINLAEAVRNSRILQAQGKAQEIILRSKATVKKIDFLSSSLQMQKGDLAARYNIAELYVSALGKLEGKNILIKGEVNDPKEMVRQALNIIDLKQGLTGLRNDLDINDDKSEKNQK